MLTQEEMNDSCAIYNQLFVDYCNIFFRPTDEYSAKRFMEEKLHYIEDSGAILLDKSLGDGNVYYTWSDLGSWKDNFKYGVYKYSFNNETNKWELSLLN